MHVLDITIDHTKVAADLTDFPVLVVPADSSDWDALYAVATGGGGDIRAFKAGGTIELPREIVSFSIDLKTGEIHIKYTGTLSSTVDTVIELHADGTSADYAMSATYGGNAVWSNYIGIWHLDADATDSSGKNAPGTVTGATFGSFAVGSGVQFNGSSHLINLGRVQDIESLDSVNVSFWIEWGSFTNNVIVAPFYKGTTSNNDLGMYRFSGANNFAVRATNQRIDVGYSLNEKTKASYSYSRNDAWKPFQNGVAASFLQTGGVTNLTTDNSADFRLGNRSAGGANFLGWLDEFRLSNTVQSAEWELVEYENQNSPETFYAATAVATGTAYTLTCEAGTLALDAAPSTLSLGRVITTDAGTLALATEPATLELSWNLALETGTLELSGETASLARSTSLVANPGTLSLEAQNAALRLSYSLEAQTLDMTINSAPAAIYAALTQPLEPGSLLLSGEPVDFVVASIINPFCPMPNPFTNSASPFSQMDNPLTDFPKGEC